MFLVDLERPNVGAALGGTIRVCLRGRQSTPMTYQLGRNRKQFIVIAAGGHGKLRTKKGDSLVAFALP